MRTLSGCAVTRTLLLLIIAATAWIADPLLVAAPRAHAAEVDDACESGGGDPEDERRLEAAIDERKRLQRELNEVLDDGELLIAEIETTEQRRAELERKEDVLDRAAGDAADELAARVRRSYMLQRSDPMLSMLAATDADDVVQHSHVLRLLAEGSRANLERASSAAQRTAAAADHAATVGEQLTDLRSRYDEVEARARRLLDEAEQQEARLSDKVASQRAANAAKCPLPPGEVANDLACPVDQPRSYSDTWGAPRSGGRRHEGVDILAPIGTPIRAYENGTVTRMNVSSLGGISLYMRGDSGNQYYYTHLSGYASGVSTGDRVSVGQHIAYNGDTGNAAGIPHLHWEIRPGGGAKTNPYPYARAACG